MGVTVLVFAVEQQKVCTKCISSEFWERTVASFKMACIWKGGEGGAKVQYPLSRFSIGRSNSATDSALHYAYSQHIESHLCKKQPQAKIPIAFLFNQLHFTSVTSHALFHGNHLVMRSKRCAVQNRRITLMADSTVWGLMIIFWLNH